MDGPDVLILVCSGPGTPAPCAAPFHVATRLACMDARVSVFLTGEATQLARAEVADHLVPVAGGEPVRHFIRQAKLAGARLLMCRQPGVPLAEATLSEALDEISSGGGVGRLIHDIGKVLSL